MKIYALLEDIVGFVESTGPCTYDQVAEFFGIPVKSKSITDPTEAKKDAAAQISELKGRLGLLAKQGKLQVENGKYRVSETKEEAAVYDSFKDSADEEAVQPPYVRHGGPFDPDPVI